MSKIKVTRKDHDNIFTGRVNDCASLSLCFGKKCYLCQPDVLEAKRNRNCTPWHSPSVHMFHQHNHKHKQPLCTRSIDWGIHRKENHTVLRLPYTLTTSAVQVRNAPPELPESLCIHTSRLHTGRHVLGVHVKQIQNGIKTQGKLLFSLETKKDIAALYVQRNKYPGIFVLL